MQIHMQIGPASTRARASHEASGHTNTHTHTHTHPHTHARPQTGAWAEHKGSFDSGFFRDFKTSPEGFEYKFVADGEGERPVTFQKVFVDCAPTPAS